MVNHAIRTHPYGAALVQSRTLRPLALVLALVCTGFLYVRPAAAQDPPPKIGPFVVDIHGTMPRFPTSKQQLADSRDLLAQELPGAGLGLHGGAHVYPLRWKAVTFGIGADLTTARAHRAAPQLTATTFGRATTERFTHLAPEISFNFGNGNGWSYLSGGIGTATWSVVPDTLSPTAPDQERLKTINYGGGARWFIKHHIAFSFDVRFYAIDPSTPLPSHPSGPRTTLVIMGAGISVK